MMAPETWKSVKEIFQTAIDLEPEDREAYLAGACGSDEEISREVRVLLDHHAEAAEFLEIPARRDGMAIDGMPVDAMKSEDVAEMDEDYWVGRRIGAYQVVRKLGRGGTSTVFLATRADDAYRHKAAIKLLRRGLDTDDILKRFRQERQILAGLDHSHIARLLDGGTTEDGRPYLVMEYVRGQPIDVYCDQHRLSTNRRLRLFRTVCSAVHYAHSNLVVHRDLKPSNILVSDDGVPKLLDFGIAKLLGAELAAVSLVSTVAAHRVMTPRYASPEQVRGLPITTASDVYSLGVLLYELVTGHRPYHLGGRLTPDGLAPDIERVICEEEPPPPSSVVTLTGEAPTLETVARARGVDPRKLRGQLAGDLDNVVLMALAKEPERRYASAHELAQDIHRWLGGRPIRAQPATWSYRTGKFIKRHKAGVTVAVLVWMALILGLGAALWQASVARAERDRAEMLLAEAETQRARAEHVISLLVDVFRVVEPGETRGQTPTAEEILARGTEKVRQKLSEQPDVRATMLDAIGQSYYGLGFYDEAVRHFDEALEIRRGLFAEDHVDVAESLYHRGWIPHARGDLEGAEPYYREALEIRRALLAPDDPAVAEMLNELAELLLEMGHPELAERWLLEALEVRRRTLGPLHQDIATSLDDLAILESSRGRYGRAVELHQEALAMRRHVLGPLNPAVASTLNGLGQALYQMGRFDEAEKSAREALEMWREIYGEEHRTVAGTLIDLGQILTMKEGFEAAENMLRKSLAMSRQVLGDDHPQVAIGLKSLAYLFFIKGDFQKAEPLHRQALEMWRGIRGPRHPTTLRSLVSLAYTLLRWGEVAQAEELFRQAIESQREALPAGHPDLSNSLQGLGQVLDGQRECDAAEPLFREAAEIRRGALGEHWRTSEVESDLAGCLIVLGRLAEAEDLLLRAHHFLLTECGPDHSSTKLAVRRLTWLDEARSRP